MVKGNSRTLARAVAALAALVCLSALAPAVSWAATGPRLAIDVSAPDDVKAGEYAAVVIGVQNVGDEPTEAPLVLTDTAGAGLEAFGEGGGFSFFATSVRYPQTGSEEEQPLSCNTSAQTTTCTTAQSLPPGARDLFNGVVKVTAGA